MLNFEKEYISSYSNVNTKNRHCKANYLLKSSKCIQAINFCAQAIGTLESKYWDNILNLRNPIPPGLQYASAKNFFHKKSGPLNLIKWIKTIEIRYLKWRTQFHQDSAMPINFYTKENHHVSQNLDPWI